MDITSTTTARVEDLATDDLILDLARALAELTRDIVAADYVQGQLHLVDVRDRIDLLAARQRDRTR